MLELTLSIIKPDAVSRKLLGAITSRIEGANFGIVAAKMVWLHRAQVENFYHVHLNETFYLDLLASMTEGPCFVQVLSGEKVIATYRQFMGATDPTKAKKGTLRSDYGISVTKNSLHGSDSASNAAREIHYFFPLAEIFI